MHILYFIIRLRKRREEELDITGQIVQAKSHKFICHDATIKYESADGFRVTNK